MAILRIRKYGDPILRKRCNPVEKPGTQEESVLDDMAETMYDAKGAGLAAPQVGINKRLIVVDVGEGLIKLLNSKIIWKSEGEDFFEEGCLSLPEIIVGVKRAEKVIVGGLNVLSV